MAATAPKDIQQLLDQLLCSICREYFTDPVITSCGHNFCRGCIVPYWERGEPTTCPECRTPCSQSELKPNKQLGKAAQKAKCLLPAAPQSVRTDSGVCEILGDAPRPFGQAAQTPVSAVCRESQVHKDPGIICLEDAAQDGEATRRPKTLSRCEEEENCLKPRKTDSETQTEEYKEEHRSNWKKHKVALGVALGVGCLVLMAVVVLPVSLSGRSPAVLGPACLDGWVGYRGKCFYFSEGEGNWTYSWNNCSALGASLAGIDTPQEMDFLLRYKGTSDYWIGLWRDSGQPWKWANNTEFNNLFVIGGDGYCAYLNEKKVGSSRCSGDLPWICSKPDAFTAANVRELLAPY